MNSVSKSLSCLAVCAGVFALVSCGDDSVNQHIDQTSDIMQEVDDDSLLQPCAAENEGTVVLVKKDMKTVACVDGRWQTLVGGESVQYSCTTENLSDKSGVKVVCNGDSVGVVLNGRAGKSGLNAEDCSVEPGKNSLEIVITCGDVSKTLNFDSNREDSSEDSSEVNVEDDSRPVSLDSLSGYSHKGPFVKGSVVYLYELANGRTLKQTNGNFVGTIKSDDGRFTLSARNLQSQYALLQAVGYYRNEVDGQMTKAKLALLALTDVSSRNTANVNLLTHLEYNRVQYLVTKKKKTLKAAKKQAQAELLSVFHVDTTGIKNSEDLSLAGKSKGDAALIAISILLQGDRRIAELTELLSVFSKDMETDGAYNDKSDYSISNLAAWAYSADVSGRFAKFRKNVESWKLSDSVPDFESILRNFWMMELLGKSNFKDGEIFTVTVDYDVETVFLKNGLVKKADHWDLMLNKACFEKNKGEKVVYHQPGANYDIKFVCDSGSWRISDRFLSDSARMGTMTDSRDENVYKTVYIGKYNWMAENLRYRYVERTLEQDSSSYCDINYYDVSECGKMGRTYLWSAAIDSVALANDPDHPQNCGYNALCKFSGFVRGICPEGWHLPVHEEIESLENLADIPYSLMTRDTKLYWSALTDEYMLRYATDVYGFGALLGHFNFWSSAIAPPPEGCVSDCSESIYAFVTYAMSGNVGGGISYEDGRNAMYIRCVEDY